MEGDSTAVPESSVSSLEQQLRRESSQKDMPSKSGSSLPFAPSAVQDNHLSVPADEIPELRLLTSTSLTANATFVALKSHLEHFYKSKDRGKSLHPGKSLQWIAVLYSSLFSALLEVNQETHPATRLSRLDEVQKWFAKRSCSTARASDPARIDFFMTRPHDSSTEQTSQSPPSKRSLTPTVTNIRSCPDSRTPSEQRTRCDARILESLETNRAKLKTARSTHRNVDLWRRRKSRYEEESLAKAEKNSLVARVLIPVSSRYRTPSTAAEFSAVKPPMRVSCYQWPKSQNVVESEPTEEVFPAVMSRMQRIRLTNRAIYQDVCASGYYHYRNMDSLSAYHPRSDQHSSCSVSHSLDVSVSETDSSMVLVDDIRKKLARAKVPCSYRALTFALKKPCDLPASALRLPAGGEYLSPNPFFSKRHK